MVSAFKVSVPVEIFNVICGCDLTIVGPVLFALQILVVGSTLTPMEGGIPEHCAWGGSVRVRHSGLSVLPGELLDRCLEPACSQSPYGVLSVVLSTEWGHQVAPWPTLPHWKHKPTSLSHLYTTFTRSPFELMI